MTNLLLKNVVATIAMFMLLTWVLSTMFQAPWNTVAASAVWGLFILRWAINFGDWVAPVKAKKR